ncbi:MAG: NAD-dependent epimerase/dehydratase family protein [Chlorobiaceae bacterium]|nr:NAD-dependent epimerase/dehydratase family protein [Chlorobiaceae bacterium]NTV61274.1 NAD-dependent epimerase/dehydratase family protein [Chlorobiaceae bacterium]
MGETVLVTGSTGFIGARLLLHLAREGEKVRVLLRPESRTDRLPGNIEVVRASYDDSKGLAVAVRGADRIVHLAGVTRAARSSGFEAGNVTPVKNILSAVREANPSLKRFLLVSSLAAAGPASEGIRGVSESDEAKPVSAYGRSKLLAERIAMESPDIPVTIVRPPAVYGPGDRDVLQVFRMLSKGLLVSAGDARRQRFSMIYADDLVRGIMAAARSPHAAGRIYYITSSRSWSWEEVIDAARPVLCFENLVRISLPKPLVYLLGSVAGTAGSLLGIPTIINRDKAAELVQDFWVCDPGRAEEELDFRADTGLPEGIEKTVAWYRSSGWM